MESQIVGPMLQINFESVREMKELRKHYERLTDKYDNALVRSDKTGVKDSFRDVKRNQWCILFINLFRKFTYLIHWNILPS